MDNVCNAFMHVTARPVPNLKPHLSSPCLLTYWLWNLLMSININCIENHRIIKPFELEKTFKRQLVQPPCNAQGNLYLTHAIRYYLYKKTLFSWTSSLLKGLNRLRMALLFSVIQYHMHFAVKGFSIPQAVMVQLFLPRALTRGNLY